MKAYRISNRAIVALWCAGIYVALAGLWWFMSWDLPPFANFVAGTIVPAYCYAVYHHLAKN
jgi:uncharacterized membrane protein